MEEKVEMSLESFIEIIDTSKEYEEDSNKLHDLLNYIFENAELDYNNNLRFYNSDKIMDYLKISESYRYKMKVEELKMKKEVDNNG